MPTGLFLLQCPGTIYLLALVNRGGPEGNVMTCERKREGGGRQRESGSLDFFCMVEFPRQGEPHQGHSPAREAGRKPQAGVMLPNMV